CAKSASRRSPTSLTPASTGPTFFMSSVACCRCRPPSPRSPEALVQRAGRRAAHPAPAAAPPRRSEEHTSELQSPCNLVCRLLLDLAAAETYTLSLHDALPISARRARAGGLPPR